MKRFLGVVLGWKKGSKVCIRLEKGSKVWERVK